MSPLKWEDVQTGKRGFYVIDNCPLGTGFSGVMIGVRNGTKSKIKIDPI